MASFFKRLAGVAFLVAAFSGGAAHCLAGDAGPINGQFPPDGVYGLEKALDEHAPIDGEADWTMNFWVNPDAPVRPRMLIAGFGDSTNHAGQPGYFANFAEGLQFWGGSVNVPMNQSLEPGRWRMLTAVHSGGQLKLYGNGLLAADLAVRFGEAAPEVHLAPFSPWPDGHRFAGRIAAFTFQDHALSGGDVAALYRQPPAFDQLTYSKGSPEHWKLQWKVTSTGDEQQSPDTYPKSKAAPSDPRKRIVKPAPASDGDGAVILAGPWKMAAAPGVPEDGAALSQPGAHAGNWYDATVPGTVLTTLVDQGVQPDPYLGLNNLSIPESLNKQDYWYRIEFAAPEPGHSKYATLTFNGINYHAEIWLNGHYLGDITGAFRRGIFPVGDILGKVNALAVRVSPPPHPGIPHEKSVLAGAGQNGGAMTQDGPTFFCSEGWDWIPAIRDRDTGIWQEVALKPTGPVTLGDPRVITRLAEPIGSRADVTVAVELENQSNAAQTGSLSGTFEGVAFEKRLTLRPREKRTVCFAPAEFPGLAVAQPRLWWPNGYGRPDLYHLKLAFTDAKGALSDTRNLQFGMREISIELSALDARRHVRRYEFFPALSGSTQVIRTDHQSLGLAPEGWVPEIAAGQEHSPALKPSEDTGPGQNLVIKVNGTRIAIRGGNWGMDDAMKRVSRARLEPYIRLERDANFNMIRNWCGQSTSEAFYDLCDQYGLLVWNEFWLSTENTNFEPDSSGAMLDNARDVIERFRNHPCIALWCGRNEGVPPPAINQGFDELIRKFDGTRYYQPNSRFINLLGSGPWAYLDPVSYFTSVGMGFTTELGLPSPLSADSMKAMMAPADLWPPGDVWAYHDWCPGNAMNTLKYMVALGARYGAPSSFEDFERKAQMVNYVSHRAMFEGMNASLWNPATGRLMWMSHPSWPSTVWQIYGWNYDANASYYGVKKACEPIHVQLNLPDDTVMVCNTSPAPLPGVKVSARVFNLAGNALWANEGTLDVPADATAGAFKAALPGDDDACFVKLELRDRAGSLLSDNFYWVAPTDSGYLAMDAMPKVRLTAQAEAVRDSRAWHFTVPLTNGSNTPALMALLSIRDARTGSKILPAFYGENYVNLLPGESRVVTAEAPLAAGQGPFAVSLEGWNIVPSSIAVAVR